MKTVHVLRKPCSESTVALNVLEYGTGALNVDVCRVGNWQTRLDTACNKGDTGRARFNTLGPVNTTGYTNLEKNGRWPANLVLQHLDGCRQDGTREVATCTAHQINGTTGGFVYGDMGNKRVGTPNVTYANENGKETIAAWTCEPGCPVAALDASAGLLQSGSSSGHRNSPKTKGVYGRFKLQDEVGQQGDKGSASRFFKQVGGGMVTLFGGDRGRTG